MLSCGFSSQGVHSLVGYGIYFFFKNCCGSVVRLIGEQGPALISGREGSDCHLGGVVVS